MASNVLGSYALERAQPGGKCAVWGIATPKLWNTAYRFDEKVIDAKALSLRKPANYEDYYLSSDVPFVSTDDPLIMNQRIIAQSGTFVVPGVLHLAVEEIVTKQGAAYPADWIVQFVIDVDAVRSDAMAALYRMNVSNATLFPGLDGMARSLAYELENHWAYDPKTFEAMGDYGPEFEELRDQKLPT